VDLDALSDEDIAGLLGDDLVEGDAEDEKAIP
jgi:hypothetical protein